MGVSVTELDSSRPKCRTFTVDVSGNRVFTTVTSTPSVVGSWLRKTLRDRRSYSQRLVVGLGVQWRPSLKPGDNQPAATLQLCVGRRCLVFQLVHAGSVPRLLRRFLCNPCNTFVGIWNHSDAKKLLNSKHQLSMRGPVDLRHHVTSVNGDSLERESIERIARDFLGWDLPLQPAISRSDWRAFELSHKQVGQACADAYVSFEIGRRIEAWEISD